MASSVYYLPIVKNSRKTFFGKLKNYKSLAQQIFPVYGMLSDVNWIYYVVVYVDSIWVGDNNADEWVGAVTGRWVDLF